MQVEPTPALQEELRDTLGTLITGKRVGVVAGVCSANASSRIHISIIRGKMVLEAATFVYFRPLRLCVEPGVALLPPPI